VKAVVLTGELLAAAWMGSTMTVSQPSLRLVGETVTLSYVADPSVSYGRFRLVNQTVTAVTAAVQSAWLQLAEGHQTLAEVTIFDVDEGWSVDAAAFPVDAAATKTFLLGFPRIHYEPRCGESVAVGLQLRVDHSEVQALAPIKFVRRDPARS
jgi:hypothetical protein